jgi:hypothetical protein
MELNNGQTIFTIFYGLYFAVILTLTRHFQPFDTPQMYRGNLPAWKRFLVSFIILNIIPVFAFSKKLKYLGKPDGLELNFLSILGLFFLSILGFGFYRIYWGVMLLRHDEKYLFYDDSLPRLVEKELKQREPSHKKSMPHLIPGIIWVVFFWVTGIIIISCFFIVRTGNDVKPLGG